MKTCHFRYIYIVIIISYTRHDRRHHAAFKRQHVWKGWERRLRRFVRRFYVDIFRLSLENEANSATSECHILPVGAVFGSLSSSPVSTYTHNTSLASQTLSSPERVWLARLAIINFILLQAYGLNSPRTGKSIKINLH